MQPLISPTTLIVVYTDIKRKQKILNINFNDIHQAYYYLISNYRSVLSDEEQRLLLYYICIEIILHEFNHIRQYQLLKSGNNSIEKQLIDLSFVKRNNDNLNNINLFYQAIKLEYLKKGNFYLLTPTERMANIKTMNKCLELINIHNLSNSFKYIFDYKRFLYEKHGYLINTKQKIISPLQQYLEIRNDIAKKVSYSAVKIDINDSIELNNKILYGLKIEYDELKDYFDNKYLKVLKRER